MQNQEIVKKPKVISVTNNKGGVAKTITSTALAGILSKRGNKVLLIDLDQQGNASATVNVRPQISEKSIYDLFFTYHEEKDGNGLITKTAYNLEDVTYTTEYENLDVIPSNTKFASAITQLISLNIPNKDNILKRAIQKCKVAYDYIIIDCPPSRDILIANALMPSDYVIIPSPPEMYAIDGIHELLNFINDYKDYMDNFKGLGILVTMYEERRKTANNIGDNLKTVKYLNCFDTVIHRSSQISDSTANRALINYHNQNSRPSKEYSKVVDELEQRLGVF